MEVRGKRLEEKIAKIRWRPGTQRLKIFATGSYGGSNSVKAVKLFCVKKVDYEFLPCELSNYTVSKSVTELQFMNENLMCVSDAGGLVTMYKIEENDPFNITVDHHWCNLHLSSAKLAICNEHIITVGLDKRINLLNVNQKKIVRSLEASDPLGCVTFPTPNEFLVGDSNGLTYLWDLRAPDDLKSRFKFSDDNVPISAITHHPTQNHIIVVGDENGRVGIRDLRNFAYWIDSVQTHAGIINEMQFSAKHPNNLFACSTNGSFWRWKMTAERANPYEDIDSSCFTTQNLTKHHARPIIVPARKSINSLSVYKERVCCGCENAKVYLYHKFNFN